MKRVLEIEFVLILLSATFCLADVRNVPMDYLTIQVAIDDANDGDTVLVASGIYTGDGNRDIDFRGKAITVKSEFGPEACTIDSQGTEDDPHRGFFFHSSEDANSILEGFTITNGYTVYPTMGGGIYCDASSPRISNCIVSENAARLGGGIVCKDSNAIITDCVIIGNSAIISKGGGIFCINASPHILDCLITENTAFEDGGGVKCDYSNPTITRCVIRNNTAEAGGGIGIGTMGGVPSQLKMINCLITGNTSRSRGGGIHALGEITLLNCIIFGNRADVNGGGIYFGVTPRIVNNSIIYGNIIPRATGSEISQNPPGAAGCEPYPIKIKHSIVGSDSNAIYMPHCYSVEWLHADPLFANPGFWDANDTPDDPNDDFWVEGDYHLKSQAGRWDPNSQSWPCTESGAGWVVDDVTSPCIDAGDPNSPVGLEPFPNGGRINMGAYGGTIEASKSYFGEPVCETIIAGDINGDCVVDFKDLAIMALHWMNCDSEP